MSDQEKVINGVEGNLGGGNGGFGEKLKAAEGAEGKENAAEAHAGELSSARERVQKSEAALEQAQERLAKVPSPVKTATKDDDKDQQQQKEHVKFHAKDVAALQNPEDQIKRIVELASTKDPYFAIKVAKHIDSNYILDKVHDKLTEEQVREALIKKGLLEELR